MSATPTFDPLTRSPTLRALFKARLAPIREKELLRKARDPEKPTKPPAGDCCGSSCKPCVMDLYREELKVWKECWVQYEEDVQGDEAVKGSLESESGMMGAVKEMGQHGRRMPGSFEW